MARPITDDMRAPNTPASVRIESEARAPELDPTLGVSVLLQPTQPAKHRLVALGDSLTHGFQSGAIYNTALAYPRIVAWELGWYDQFRYPRYGGPGGLPMNVELLVRRLEREFGSSINWWELASSLFALRSYMDEVEDYWERGPGAAAPVIAGIHHNLGIYGWDLRDALTRSAGICAASLRRPKDDWLMQLVQGANDRAALRVLPSLRSDDDPGLPSVGAAQALGKDGGIETLLICLGANNALGSVVRLEVKWSQAGASGKDYQDLEKKKAFTVWDPEHFAVELAELERQVSQIEARHVIWATVPHVTISPIARGVASKVAPRSRYFPYYTRPWIKDNEFDPRDDPHITEAEARAIDSAIDQYNVAITELVRRARQAGRDWYLLDLAGVLDRLAVRRYIDDPSARPNWWTPYELPPALQQLRPVPDSRFFGAGPEGRTQGGLFSLDGVHPTTIAYGIVAQEFIQIMQLAGVRFYYGDGRTERTGPVLVDFNRLIAQDTLICDPPRSFSADLSLLSWVDDKIDFFKRLF
jgi:hypothetical protein